MDASSLGDRRCSSSHHVVVELGESGASPTGITPPPVPLLLSFADLTYVVKKQTNRLLRLPSPFIGRRTRLTPESSTAEPSGKVVLNSVSGEARDGGILAVLGASGAGKSTLIDALAHRISRQSLQGSITLNGESLEPRLLKSISAYVMQDDLLFPMLTVEETLMFSAEFRLPRSLPRPAKKARVQALIDQLGLRDAAHTVIGDEGHRGVSGGERRRVSIGVDIIHDPVILFLDEPTSGLDSTSAFMVVRVLQRIARSGSIVVMSVHQPSARLLALVDHLMVLSRGQVAYAGPTASLTDFFSEFGDPVPPNENPAEYALDLIRELEASPDGAVTLVEFHKSWRKTKDQAGGSNCSLTLKDAIAESISRGKLMSGARSEPLSVRAFANPFWVEMLVLTRRTSVNYGRMPGLFITRSATVIITGFILATLFWRLDKSQGGLRDRFGLMIIVMATVYYICTESLPVFMKERYIFMRETAHNTYRRSSYVLANSLSGLPSLVFLSLVFASMTFFAVGMAGGAQGFIFYLLTILAYFWAGTSLVTLVSGVVKHELMGHVVAMSALSYFQLFCGFFISRDRIPRYWIWLHYVSPNKYVYEAFMLNEFGGLAECFAAGGAACATTGADVLRQEGIGDHWFSKWDRLLVTVGWGVLYRIFFYLSLSIGGKITRK